MLNVLQPSPCSERDYCSNSPAWRGEGGAKCYMCRLAVDGDGGMSFWHSQSGKRKHPALEAEKRQKSRDRSTELATKRQNVDRGKRKLLKRAVRAEKTTESDYNMKSTVNSGRSHQDGDHKLGELSLDTKLQTTKVHPVVNLVELDKIRRQAKTCGSSAGGLVLENCNGRKVVVFAHEDLKNILSGCLR